MTHDDFCLTPDADPCTICDLIAMVRRDEQDAIAGLYETDVSEVEAVAYQRGYEEGTKQSIVKEPIVQTNSIDLDSIKQYILNNVTTFSLDQTNTLYALYIHLGGK